jgi:hypothetical protein
VDNRNESPYIPARTLEHKWCARVPLGYTFHDQDGGGGIDEEEKQKLFVLSEFATTAVSILADQCTPIITSSPIQHSPFISSVQPLPPFFPLLSQVPTSRSTYMSRLRLLFCLWQQSSKQRKKLLSTLSTTHTAHTEDFFA